MSVSDLAERIDGIAHAWEQFKTINDQRLKEIEQNGYTQYAISEQLQRINDTIDSYKQQIDKLELAGQRPELDCTNLKSCEYNKSFDDYLRKGITHENNQFIHKELSERGDGQFIIQPKISRHISQTLMSLSPMRQLASTIEVSSSSYDAVVDDSSSMACNWRAESDNVGETAPPAIKAINIEVQELYAQPQISKRLLNDSLIDVSSWLINKLIDLFNRTENSAFVNGIGASMPNGVLSGISETNSIKATKLDGNSIINLYFSLNEHYTSNASFLMNRSTLQQIRLMKTFEGQYLWQPGLASKVPDTIMGIPVYQSPDMPILDELGKADKAIIIVGDFKRAYTIVDNKSINILRDPFTNKPFVKFYTTKRVGGNTVDPKAMTGLIVKPKKQ